MSVCQALSALREQQARVLSDQGELQATVSQMRDEIKSKDAELAKLKPDHRPSFWTEPKQARRRAAPRASACAYVTVAALRRLATQAGPPMTA